jgi:hypothetical protein
LTSYAVEHVAGEIEIRSDVDSRQVARNVPGAVEEQTVPPFERRAGQPDAGLLVEMRRAEQLAGKIVGPAVHGTDDVFRVASTLQHHGLPMAADVRQQLDALRTVDERLRVVARRQDVIVARFRHH